MTTREQFGRKISNSDIQKVPVKILSSAGNEPVVGSYNLDGIAGTDYKLAGMNFITNYNGVTWDRVRNNTQGTLLASAARTASIITPTQTNYNARGVMLFLEVSAASGTGGLTVHIRGLSPQDSGSFWINPNPSPIIAASNGVFVLYPGASTTAPGTFQVSSGILPRTWAVEITHGDASSYTYSLGYSYVL